MFYYILLYCGETARGQISGHCLVYSTLGFCPPYLCMHLRLSYVISPLILQKKKVSVAKSPYSCIPRRLNHPPHPARMIRTPPTGTLFGIKREKATFIFVNYRYFYNFFQNLEKKKSKDCGLQRSK